MLCVGASLLTLFRRHFLHFYEHLKTLDHNQLQTSSKQRFLDHCREFSCKKYHLQVCRIVVDSQEELLIRKWQITS